MVNFNNVYSEHGIQLTPEEVSKATALANDDGEITREEFVNYAKHSEFFKNQLDRTDSDSMAAKRESIAKVSGPIT